MLKQAAIPFVVAPTLDSSSKPKLSLLQQKDGVHCEECRPLRKMLIRLNHKFDWAEEFSYFEYYYIIRISKAQCSVNSHRFLLYFLFNTTMNNISVVGFQKYTAPK